MIDPAGSWVLIIAVEEGLTGPVADHMRAQVPRLLADPSHRASKAGVEVHFAGEATGVPAAGGTMEH